jgi:hypothetical protein
LDQPGGWVVCQRQQRLALPPLKLGCCLKRPSHLVGRALPMSDLGGLPSLQLLKQDPRSLSSSSRAWRSAPARFGERSK